MTHAVQVTLTTPVVRDILNAAEPVDLADELFMHLSDLPTRTLTEDRLFRCLALYLKVAIS